IERCRAVHGEQVVHEAVAERDLAEVATHGIDEDAELRMTVPDARPRDIVDVAIHEGRDMTSLAVEQELQPTVLSIVACLCDVIDSQRQVYRYQGGGGVSFGPHCGDARAFSGPLCAVS